MRCAPGARSSGRDWKIAECSLSMGSSVAPPSRTACMNSSPPTTSASLLASSRRLPARAAAMHGARPGRAHDGRHDGIDHSMRRHHFESAWRRTAPGAASRSPRPFRQRAGMRLTRPSRRIAGLHCSALRQHQVDRRRRAERKHLEAVRMARNHVERVDADGAGGAQDADALLVETVMRDIRSRA